MMAKFEIINATDSLIQNIIRILSLPQLTYLWYLKPKNPRDHAELSLKRSRWTPNFYSVSETSNHYLFAVEVKKKSIE